MQLPEFPACVVRRASCVVHRASCIVHQAPEGYNATIESDTDAGAPAFTLLATDPEAVATRAGTFRLEPNLDRGNGWS